MDLLIRIFYSKFDSVKAMLFHRFKLVRKIPLLIFLVKLNRGFYFFSVTFLRRHRPIPKHQSEER